MWSAFFYDNTVLGNWSETKSMRFPCYPVPCCLADLFSSLPFPFLFSGREDELVVRGSPNMLCILKILWLLRLKIWRLSTLQCWVLWLSHLCDSKYWCTQMCLQYCRLLSDLASVTAEVIKKYVTFAKFRALACFLTC